MTDINAVRGEKDITGNSVKDLELEKQDMYTTTIQDGGVVRQAEDGGVAASGEPAEDKLHRGLSGVHMQMIAFGGSIGTGLFVGSGKALATGGPAFLLLNFMLVGAMVYTVVMALGELATALPAWGFAMGWNYWLQWLIVLPFELTVATIVIQYWDVDQKISPGIWIALFLVLIIIINLFGVRGYGNVEVAASLVKIVAILIFFFVAVIVDLGGSPSGKYLGAKTWHNPGATHNGWKGFVSIFVTAAFAFNGTELVGLAARESANPRKEVPKASKQVVYRILIFYIVSLFLVGLIVPYNNPHLMGAKNASSSPFVIAMNIGGIKFLPDAMNAVILVSVLSVGNSATYGASRTIAGMAHVGLAPKFLGKIDSKGRPIWAVFISLIVGCLAFLQYASNKSVIFSWLLAISGLSGILSWLSICLAHIRFRMAWTRQGHSLEELPWQSPVGIWGSVFGFVFNMLVLILTFYIAVSPIHPASTVSGRLNDFFQSYLTIPVIICFFIFAKIKWRTKVPTLVEIDLDSGREIVPIEILRAEREEAKRQPFSKKALAALC
ncbi:hypothetical protein OC842_007026 [Tilletia horrida]|uniref:Amino acid permease/ SLC12A domain-containing protein n=1 Tax=Tilletia horrida TaxID=155126 RepID=A0AAN6G7H0_9BASI|nr:hypothetical protein OC842_007026 [Tilletia horrida]